MIDLEKDIEIEIAIVARNRRRALANIYVGGLFAIYGFEITQSASGKLYVVNPHVVSNSYIKADGEKTVNYKSTATLLPHEDRKKIVRMILDKYAEELDKMRMQVTEGNKVDEMSVVNEKTWHNFKTGKTNDSYTKFEE